MPLAPVMIYGDDVTHVLTEEGIAYLYKARSLEERKAMIAAVAGVTPIGLRHDPASTPRCAATASSRCPRTSASHRSRGHAARCWRRRAWPIWSTGRTACTTRPRTSGAGNARDLA